MLKTACFKGSKRNHIINHVDYYVERVKEIPQEEKYDYFMTNYVLKDEVTVLQDFKDQDRDWKDVEFKVRRRKWYDFVRQNFVEKGTNFKCIGHWHSWVLNPSYENEFTEFFDLNYVIDNSCVQEKLSHLYFSVDSKVVSRIGGKGSTLVSDYIDQLVDEELMTQGYLPYRMTYEEFLEVRVAEKAFLSRICRGGLSSFEKTENLEEKDEERGKSENLEIKGSKQKETKRRKSSRRKSAVKEKVGLMETNVQGGKIELQGLEIREVVEPILSYANIELELWIEEEVGELAYAYPKEEAATVLTSLENPCCGKASLLDLKIKEVELTVKLKNEKKESDEVKSGTGDTALKLVGYVSDVRLMKIEKRPYIAFRSERKEDWSRGFKRWNLSKRRFVSKRVSRADEFPVLVKDVKDRPRCHLGNQVKRLLLSRRVCVLL